MDRRRFIARLGAVSTPLVAGCLGDGGGEPSPPADSPTGTSTRGPTATRTEGDTGSPSEGTPSARSAYPDYNWAALDGVDPEATTEVTLRNTAFHPAVAAVQPGTAVTFANNDGFGHTVTVPALEVARELDGGESTTITFETAGRYGYVCEFHPPGMVGRVVVAESTPTPTSSPTSTPTSGDSSTPSPTPTPTATEDDGGYY